MPGKKSRLFRDELASARYLRGRSTKAEKWLWREIRGRRFEDMKFRRQHPVGQYVVDFFCAKASLAIEVDGGGHGIENQIEIDEHRTRELERLGIRVLRFWNTDVLGNPEGVLKTIAEALEAPSP